MEFDDPEVETQRSDEIDLTDQGSQSVGSKRKAGRPVTNAWDTFKKVPNPDPGKSKRNWMGVCQFCDCKIASGKVEDYEGDVEDMSRSTINNSNIQASVNVKAVEFDLDFSGKVDQVEMPDMDFGTSDASEWNVDDLLQVT